MTETATTRFGFTHWGNSATDGPSMVEFNNAFTALENYAAKDTQDVIASRPAAGEAQRYFYATDTDVLYRDNGSAWKVVGGKVVDQLLVSSTNAAVPLTVNAPTGQTADLVRAQVNSVSKFVVDKDGKVTCADVTGANAKFTSTATGTPALIAKAIGGQTANLVEVQNSSGSVLSAFDKDGVLSSPYGNFAADKSLVGGTGFTTLANQTLFTGTPAMEVRSTKGGVGTYNDGLVVRHPSFDGSAVSRRLGILLKMGDEISGDVAKAGGMYIESSAASAASPSLVLHRADAAALTIPSSGQATLHNKGLITQDTNDINKTGAASLRFNSNAQMGAQGNSWYARVPSGQSFYFYGSGSHSDTPGDANGGFQTATLTAAGDWTTTTSRVTNTNDATLAQASPAFMIGAAGSANMIGSANKWQARNNGAAAALTLNGAGGAVNISASGADTAIKGGLLLHSSGYRLTIATSQPSTPSVGDVWIDIH